MAATATINSQEVQGGLMAYCTVSDGSTSVKLAVFMSQTTAKLVPNAELGTYLQARALLAGGHPDSATALVTPFATGTASTGPGVPDTRHWAALWMAGQIPS